VPVLGGPEPLSGIVARLLDNAIRYSPAGGPIHVSVGTEQGAAVCRVIDRGVGIAERDLPRLFTRFGRIANGRTDGVRGAGLALHLSRELALLHGGDIAVESTPGAGSSFSLVLPRIDAEALGDHDVTRFGLGDMIACSAAFREIGVTAGGFEDAAARIVRHLREALRDGPDGDWAAALVRLFRARPLGRLDPGLRARVGRGIDEAALCMVLEATAGEREEWNFPARSAGHLVVPLPAGAWWPPMTARLLGDLGVDPGRAGSPEPFRDLLERACNVFHVAEAAGSRYVPDQEAFVRPCAIRSVLGFGGALAPAELYAVVVFSRAPIPPGCAALFRAVSRSAGLVLRRYVT
jgi:hypothetical protein